MFAPWKKSYDKPRQHIKKQRHRFANKSPYSQSYFLSSHTSMWVLNHKAGWALKNWCFWTVVQEKTLECPLDSKKIEPVNPKGNWYWIFIGRTDAEAVAPILWPPDAMSQLTAKDPDVGKDWGQKEKGAREDRMIGWLPQLSGNEFEQILGDSKGNSKGKPGMLHSVGSQSQTWLSDWTTSRNFLQPVETKSPGFSQVAEEHSRL